MLPSIKNLEAAFPGKGLEVRALLEGKKKTTDYRSVQDWERQCFTRPKKLDRMLCALNEITEGYGVEPIWGSKVSDRYPAAEYLNQGDAYAATLLYSRVTGTWRLTTVADFVERNEVRYGLQ